MRVSSQIPGSMAKVQLPLVQAARPQLSDAHPNPLPFSQSPAKDALRHLPDGLSAAAVLLLGCTDPSCLLTSLAAHRPGLQRVTAVLQEADPFLLARAAFLLLLAAELDPHSQDDMQVLWEVWYCAAWSPTTLPRVKPFIERLQHSSPSWMTAARPEDKDILKDVWASWLAKYRPSLPMVMKSRRTVRGLLEQHGFHCHGELLIEGIVQQTVKVDSLHDVGAALLERCSPQQANHHAGHLVQAVLQQDMKTYLDTGGLAPNYSGQQATRARFANITLLRPGSTDWCYSVYCSPAHCWGPFRAEELVSAVKTGGQSGLLARTTIAHISQLVRSFQAHFQLDTQSAAAAVQGDGSSSSNRTQLQVQLVCLNALQLCLGMPLSEASQPGVPSAQKPRTQAKPEPAAAVGSTPFPMMFDAVDCNVLADEVGLMPLLLAAGARLVRAPHARLYTGLMQWPHEDCTLGDVIFKEALHMPQSLTPTLLGLRLLTDLEADRPETAGEQDYTYRVDAFRELVWTPIPKEMCSSPVPKLDAQLLGGPEGSIEACLQAIATQLCCVPRPASQLGEPDCTEGTPQLLAWLLATLAERTDMSALLESSNVATSNAGNSTSISGSGGHGSNRPTVSSDDGTVEDSQAAARNARGQYEHMQRVLWALRTKVAKLLPHQFQLCFETGIDILRSSLQQHAPETWQPADVPACLGVKQLVLPQLQNLSQRMQPVLVEHKAAQQVAQQRSGSSANTGACELKEEVVPAGVHMVDTWAFERLGQAQWPAPVQCEVTVYLPADFTLSPRPSHVGLYPAKVKIKVHQSMLQGTVQAPGILAQLLLPSACPSTVQTVTSCPAQQGCHAAGSQQHAAAFKLQMVSLQETQTSYVATLQLLDADGRAVTSPDPRAMQFLHWDSLRLSYEACSIQHDVRAGSRCRHNHQWQCTARHRLAVGLVNPAGSVQPAELSLCWPIATGWAQCLGVPFGSYDTGHKLGFHADHDKGQMVLRIAKAEAWEVWPNDEAWGLLPAPINLSSLKPCNGNPEAALAYGNAAQGQRGENEKGTLWTLIHDLMRIKSINRPLASPNITRFTAYTAYQTRDGHKYSTILQLLLHPSVLMTKAGRLVLPVTVIDVSACEAACARGDLDKEWCHCLLKQLGFKPGQLSPHSIAMFDGCISLRRMLLRHALACQPTAAQQASLPDGQRIPYYYNSYLSYMQCQGVVDTTIVPVDKKPRPAGTNAYQLKFRVMEVLAEMDSCENQDQKTQCFLTLARLVGEKEASALPANLRSAMMMHLNWSGSDWYCVEGQYPEWLGKAMPCNQAEHSNISTKVEQLQLAATPTAAAGRVPACMQCGEQGCKLMKCGKCGAVEYCSRECQVEHWKQHKAVCRPHMV